MSTQKIQESDVLVVGGGIMGLATAWHLSNLNVRRVTVLEQAAVGHQRGSSNGRVRIARSTYADPGYVRLMTRARTEAWPALSQSLGRSLIRPCRGCFFGPSEGLLEKYAAGVQLGGVPVQRLTGRDARQEFPQLNLPHGQALLDTTAGVIDAEATREGLLGLRLTRGIEVRQNCQVLSLSLDADKIRVETPEGLFVTERLIITAGAWTAFLVPELASRLMVHRQDIGYFTSSARSMYPGGDFAWVYLGLSEDDIYYGLPEDERTLKAARHRRSGPIDDPDGAPENTPAGLTGLQTFVAREFEPKVSLDWSSTCPYTSTATDDFILCCHPSDDRVVIGAGFSGHGFKFSPLIGEILAQLSTWGESSIDEYQAMARQFSFTGPPIPGPP